MSLTTNLVSYWKLDESSGNAADSVGSNTLTPAGSPTYGAGKILNGIIFSGSSQQRLDNGTPSNLGIAAGGDKTISFWVKCSTSGGARLFGIWTASNHSTSVKNYLAVIDVGATGVLIMFAGDGSGTTLGSVSGTTNLTTGAFFFVVVTFTGSDNKYRIYVNGNSTPEATSAAFSTIATGSNGVFDIGSADNNNAIPGTVDEFGVWSRVLTTTEMSTLYNGGAGLSYPFTTASPNSGFLMWFGRNAK